jgi:lysozyme
MNIKMLREQLEIDEGRVERIYRDHLGYPTFGIGHLIIKNDPEYGLPIGTPISSERVNEAFSQDICNVIFDCEKLYPDFYELPEEAQQIIANMMFNLGLTRLSRFKGMKRGVDSKHWMLAADEMVDSLWYRQVPNRAKRLVERMRNIK